MVADLDPANARADSDHVADELMADDHSRSDALEVPCDDMKIRAANAGERDTDERVFGVNEFRPGHLPDRRHARRFEDDGSHRGLPQFADSRGDARSRLGQRRLFRGRQRKRDDFLHAARAEPDGQTRRGCPRVHRRRPIARRRPARGRSRAPCRRP